MTKPLADLNPEELFDRLTSNTAVQPIMHWLILFKGKPIRFKYNRRSRWNLEHQCLAQCMCAFNQSEYSHYFAQKYTTIQQKEWRKTFRKWCIENLEFIRQEDLEKRMGYKFSGKFSYSEFSKRKRKPYRRKKRKKKKEE